MARKIINFVVTDEGRDQGKTFVLTEMPSAQGEKWAMRALLGLVQSGAEIPAGIEKAGMAGLVELGFKALAGLSWELLEPLLDEMMLCVQVMPDATKAYMVRGLFPEDIEEIKTRAKLRWEIWKLHADFLETVANSISQKMATDQTQP